MQPADYKFIRDNIEPLDDRVYGPGYRASAYLTDGTFLPCVIFRESSAVVKLAIRRFKEERSGEGIFRSAAGYYQIVKNFVAVGNRVNEYDIERVEKSRFAIPSAVHRQIEGETSMGWTGFAGKMKDGKYFSFGTSFHSEFFEMPEGYTAEHVLEIVNHSYVSNSGELRSHKVASRDSPSDHRSAVIYREKPFFECFIDRI